MHGKREEELHTRACCVATRTHTPKNASYYYIVYLCIYVHMHAQHTRPSQLVVVCQAGLLVPPTSGARRCGVVVFFAGAVLIPLLAGLSSIDVVVVACRLRLLPHPKHTPVLRLHMLLTPSLGGPRWIHRCQGHAVCPAHVLLVALAVESASLDPPWCCCHRRRCSWRTVHAVLSMQRADRWTHQHCWPLLPVGVTALQQHQTGLYERQVERGVCAQL